MSVLNSHILPAGQVDPYIHVDLEAIYSTETKAERERENPTARANSLQAEAF